MAETNVVLIVSYDSNISINRSKMPKIERRSIYHMTSYVVLY